MVVQHGTQGSGWFNQRRGSDSVSIYTFYLVGPCGGSGGTAQMIPDIADPVLQNRRISEIRGNSGQYMDGLTIQLTDIGSGGQDSVHFGGTGGSMQSVFTLGQDEYLTSIFGTFGDLVNTLMFQKLVASEGTFETSSSFGDNAGPTEFSLNSPPGYYFSALLVQSGSSIDGIGGYLAKLPGGLAL